MVLSSGDLFDGFAKEVLYYLGLVHVLRVAVTELTLLTVAKRVELPTR